MKLLLFLLGSFFAIQICAQTEFEPVDRKKVEALIADSSARTHYPKLISRLKSYDTTLTLDEYRLIYYGYVFQPGYSPYSDDKSKEIRSAMDESKYDEAIKFCDEVINKNPTALRSYYYKLIAFSNQKKEDSLEKVVKLYSNFLNAIASTGDGLTCNTAFKVIRVSDEYDFMYRYLQIEKFHGQSLQYPCDKMKVSPSQYFEKEAVFFDVSESFLSLKKGLDK